jgi:hypothetical protein
MRFSEENMHVPTTLLLCASLCLTPPNAVSANRIDMVDDGAFVEQLLAARPGETVEVHVDGNNALSVSWEGPLLEPHGFTSGPVWLEDIHVMREGDMVQFADGDPINIAEPGGIALLLAALGAMVLACRPRRARPKK